MDLFYILELVLYGVGGWAVGAFIGKVLMGIHKTKKKTDYEEDTKQRLADVQSGKPLLTDIQSVAKHIGKAPDALREHLLRIEYVEQKDQKTFLSYNAAGAFIAQGKTPREVIEQIIYKFEYKNCFIRAVDDIFEEVYFVERGELFIVEDKLIPVDVNTID